MRPLLLALTLAASTAHAHFKLLTPPEWIVTDALGDPQKQGPCGSTTGTPTGVVTTVEAGATLTVKWQETVLHPGHFRLALTDDRATLREPVATVTGGVCQSALVEPAVAPILADGVFEHTAPSPTGTWETTITVPNTPCERCTLQVVQFMAQHAAPCFYSHCAEVRIVARDAGVVTDAGAGSDAGTLGADGGVTPGPPAVGCGCAATEAGSLTLLMLLGLGLLLRRR